MKQPLVLGVDTVRGLLACGIVGTVCLMALRTQTVPDVLGDLALIALGYFFAKTERVKEA